MKMNNNNSNNNNNNNTIRGGGEEGVKRGFYACYILTSLSPRHKGHTYIGYTVNPCRRIRQHNGEIVSGAYKTKRKRPWDMVLCIFGFPTNVSALQIANCNCAVRKRRILCPWSRDRFGPEEFEWAWQHPTESLAVKQAAASFKTLGGLGNKVKLAYTMLTLARWQDLKLTVNFFSSKYTKLSAGCPTLPEHMSVQVSSMDDLPCYTGIYSTQEDEYEDEDRDELDVGDLVDETDIIGKSTKEGSESTTGKTGTTDAFINEGLTNISGNNDRYGGSSVNYVNDSDHLFSWTEKIDSSFDLGLENGTKDDLERSSINLVSRNISSYDSTTYGGSSDNYVNDSDHLFSWPEKINSSFDLGLENGTKDDLERSFINLGSTNIPSYDATTYEGSSDNYVSDSDHLFSWTEKIDSNFDLGLANGTKIDLERSSINLGSTNIPGYEHMSGMTTIYRGIDDNFVNKSDFLFNSTENNYMFDVGINVSPEEDLTRYGDLYSSIGDTDRFGSTKDDRVEIDQPNKEIITRKGVCNYQPAANSPITSQKVEVIDLSTPSPGYGVGLKGKRRRVSGGVIDLTKSPIFVEV